MKPAFLRVMTPEEATAYIAVKHCAMRLPSTIRLGKDEEGKIPLSPHILSRAIERTFPLLRHADGIYANAKDHSWVVTPSGHIIDVMNEDIGSGPTIVLFSDPESPTLKLYRTLKEDEPESEHFRRYGEQFRVTQQNMVFRLAIDRVAGMLKKRARAHNERFSQLPDKFARAAVINELIAG